MKQTKRKRKKAVITVNISPDLADTLERAAYWEGKSKSFIVDKALAMFLTSLEDKMGEPYKPLPQETFKGVL